MARGGAVPGTAVAVCALPREVAAPAADLRFPMYLTQFVLPMYSTFMFPMRRIHSELPMYSTSPQSESSAAFP